MRMEQAIGHKTEVQLIADLARRHYLEDASKVELAKEFGISRFKIARLLSRGREEGIVRIEIIEPTTNLPTFSEPLAQKFGLSHTRVIGSSGSRQEVRSQLGAMGAQLLQELVRPGDNIGFGWGRTVAEVANHLHDLPPLTMLQVCGSISKAGSPSSIERARTSVEKAGGSVHQLAAPLFVRSAEARRELLDANAYIRGQFENLAVLFVSVGSWDHDGTQLRDELPPMIQARLADASPAGEIVGIWYDESGRVVAPEVTRMCVTLETYHLSKTPAVIAVAAGSHKVMAIAGAIRTGLITGLVTDRETAESLLSL